ncbi:hypothetical protein CLAFUW4_08032 [Fulvia fulva]|uniref:Vezatin n=1 Tax=Passalora fulva TaxID=5499 RepID=A0A9Q8LD06_PASFU|nr:uncharacterized protein CLAFUR5_08150 [Fulvia fulva]KAK4629248.1 hypothetical protein CLAFUR4_08037 [Fulvia fulva]KAK4630534.1 hypothetical protein CLAFUR0_08032 [Fulvia fulva]UJO15146.1 hypothetical protein CLAFUR5_08150 [Fulvia fulva]WPV12937.1 hypothetical protein CLAFUW4_08032 [Fulvia fulva]WPV27062.1 hypothetical protein CLAFUW7_08032 [Fulvia fulva]
METIHTHDSPLAAYLEGEGSFEPHLDDKPHDERSNDIIVDEDAQRPSFAPPSKTPSFPRVKIPQPITLTQATPQSAITRAHDAWSTAWNANVGRADNAKFIEHFRYTIVASQLLNEYLDHGALKPSSTPTVGLDGAVDLSGTSTVKASVYGAALAAIVALALAWLLQYSRARRVWTTGRVTLVLTVVVVVAFGGYQHMRRKWLKMLRCQAVESISVLTNNWQAFELSSSSTLSFIQEVELVSKGYRLSTPLPPASRIEESGTSRRCARLRKALHKAHASTIPACIDACAALRVLIEEDDLDKYFEVYDISTADARDTLSVDALSVLEDDPESLKSLRVLSYRAGIVRRVLLCSLMALEADGGKPDNYRWQIAIDVMRNLNKAVSASTERLRIILSETEHFNMPATPIKSCFTPNREKVRSQVRKISALSSGIRGLQAKMQILREETNRSIEQSDDLTDLGASLMAQYESIGSDLKELMAAWEAGKQSLQNNITKQERRISMASSGIRSPVSSLGGLTAVEEYDGPADALRVLNGEGSKSNRSSMATSSEEEMVFEAVAMPRQRAHTNTTLTREERIVKMHEERERQAQMRAKRDANTSMLRELESVINLRPKKPTANGTPARITSI